MKGLGNVIALCVLVVVFGHDALTSVVLNLPTAAIIVGGIAIVRLIVNRWQEDRQWRQTDQEAGERSATDSIRPFADPLRSRRRDFERVACRECSIRR